MPSWIVSIIVAIIQKTGLINWLEALAIGVGLKGLEDLKKIKTYPDYNIRKNNRD